jgi:hypothetical protein
MHQKETKYDVFGLKHCRNQPHCGRDANPVAYTLFGKLYRRTPLESNKQPTAHFLSPLVSPNLPPNKLSKWSTISPELPRWTVSIKKRMISSLQNSPTRHAEKENEDPNPASKTRRVI